MGHYLTFGSANSSTYGVLLSGEGVFNAPKRDVEMISIPGRNGEYALDRGRFENIEVTYPAYNKESTMSSFSTNLANLRNVLSSYKGYQRLEDTFHPDEYRMATFIDGFEANPFKYTTASEMELKFNCKPQRFLKSGETAVSVANNGTISNPTLFDSHPLLAVKGYGTIGINGEEIEVENVPTGNIIILNGNFAYIEKEYTYNSGVLQAGDTITLSSLTMQHRMSNPTNPIVSQPTISTSGYSGAEFSDYYYFDTSAKEFLVRRYLVSPLTFTQGTAKNCNMTYSFGITFTDSTTTTAVLSMACKYDGTNKFTIGMWQLSGFDKTENIVSGNFGNITAYSTVSALGNPLYIDLDIGECYKIVNSEPVSSNAGVQLTGELPVLKPGSNTITYDNTVTELKITPRWYIV